MRIAFCFLVLCVSTNLYAMKSADPWLSKVMGEAAYSSSSEDQELEWDIDAWTGRDLQKFWLKTSGSYGFDESGIETANIELVYSKAITSNWDSQFGMRHDLKDAANNPTRNWVSFGYIGTAPYFIEIDARIFVGEESSSQILLEAEREFMLTQKWVITSELDLTVNGNTNPARDEGSGLSEINFELKLGYEPSRQFQPFIGLGLKQLFGGSKNFVKQAGGDSGKFQALIGIEAWY